jgi:hypothetical protein
MPTHAPETKHTPAASDVCTNFARLSQRAGIYNMHLRLQRCITVVLLESRPVAMALQSLRVLTVHFITNGPESRKLQTAYI